MPTNSSPDRSNYDPACQCIPCQRIRQLDEAARGADETVSVTNEATPNFWRAWDDFDFNNPGEDRTGQPYAGAGVTGLSERERLEQRERQRRENEARHTAEQRRRTQETSILEVIEAPSACQFCGNETEPFAINGHLACEPCYERECLRLYHCHGCQNRLDTNHIYNFENQRYCNRCIRTRQDYCHGCGTVAASGTMSRDSRQRAMCGECYRPEWKPTEWKPDSNTYHLIPKDFTYGIELETSVSENYTRLEGKTAWGCVPEASTSGREFISPVMSGDAGLTELKNFIAKWGDDWEVDAYCGTHIHIGLSQFNMEQKRRIAYGYYCMWQFVADLIGPARTQNSMCGRPQWTLGDLMGAGDIEDFAEARDRFEFVNWRSLLKYGTIEIRCLKGTLDVELITAWLRWHCKFIKKCASLNMKALAKGMADPNKFGNELDPDVVNTLRRRMGVRTDEVPARVARGTRRNAIPAEAIFGSGRGR